MKCTFISVWDGNHTIRTKAKYCKSTGEVVVIEDVDVTGLDNLDREYIELENGDELEVCTNCHAFILKEDKVCPNPNCEDS